MKVYLTAATEEPEHPAVGDSALLLDERTSLVPACRDIFFRLEGQDGKVAVVLLFLLDDLRYHSQRSETPAVVCGVVPGRFQCQSLGLFQGEMATGFAPPRRSRSFPL